MAAPVAMRTAFPRQFDDSNNGAASLPRH